MIRLICLPTKARLREEIEVKKQRILHEMEVKG